MAKTTKKFYWLKLKSDFFQSKEIKKLRKLAGGDTFTIIYLKMQLLSLQDGGRLYFDGVEETLADEIALVIDEDAENVAVTCAYLQSVGLLVQDAPDAYTLPQVPMLTGQETESAVRMRAARAANRKTAAIEGAASHCAHIVQKSDTEIEKEIEIEKELEGEKEIEKEKGTAKAAPARPRFKAPTVEEVAAYCAERCNSVNAEAFVDYYTANGWRVGKNPMKDWRATVRTWEQREKANTSSRPNQQARNSPQNNNVFLDIATEEGIF